MKLSLAKTKAAKSGAITTGVAMLTSLITMFVKNWVPEKHGDLLSYVMTLLGGLGFFVQGDDSTTAIVKGILYGTGTTGAIGTSQAIANMAVVNVADGESPNTAQKMLLAAQGFNVAGPGLGTPSMQVSKDLWDAPYVEEQKQTVAIPGYSQPARVGGL